MTVSGGWVARSVGVGLGAGIIALLSAGAAVQFVDQLSSHELKARPVESPMESCAPVKTRDQDLPDLDWDSSESFDLHPCSLLMPSACWPRNPAALLDFRYLEDWPLDEPVRSPYQDRGGRP